jgi:hypothetical protein
MAAGAGPRACRGRCRRSSGWPRSWCCPPGTVWPGGLPCPGPGGTVDGVVCRGTVRFEAPSEDVLDLDALAARIAIPGRTARICADAMVALGLLERDGPLYRNSPVADAFLSGRGRGDLRPFLRYLDVSYRAWAEFTGAIRAGQGSGFITRLTVDCLTWAGEPARSWSASSAAIPPSSAGCSSFRTWSPWPGKTSRSNLR